MITSNINHMFKIKEKKQSGIKMISEKKSVLPFDEIS